MRSGRVVVAAASCLIALACSASNDTTLGPTLPERASAQDETSAEVTRDAQLVARALSKALARVEVRSTLLSAWQKSRLSTDHKLVLADYFLSAAGKDVLGAMASREGTTVEQIADAIRKLPAMDVYLPIRGHRETWKGTADVLVAITFDQDTGQVTAFDTEGNIHVVRGEDAARGRPLVILHPAEPKYAVYTDEQGTAVDVIQLANGETGTTPRQVRALRIMPHVSGVNLKYFDTWAGDGPFGGDLEMEFRSYMYDFSRDASDEGQPFYQNQPSYVTPQTGSPYWDFGASCAAGTATGNFPENPPISNLDISVSPGVTASFAGCGGISAYVYHGWWLRVFEMDGGANGSDLLGTRITGPLPCVFACPVTPYGLPLNTSYNGADYWDRNGRTSSNGGNGIKLVHLGLRID